MKKTESTIRERKSTFSTQPRSEEALQQRPLHCLASLPNLRKLVVVISPWFIHWSPEEGALEAVKAEIEARTRAAWARKGLKMRVVYGGVRISSWL